MLKTMGKKIGIIVCALLICLAPSARADDRRLITKSAWEAYGQEEQLLYKETPEVIQRMLETAYDAYTEVGGKRLKRSNTYTRWYYGAGNEVGWCNVFIAWCMAQQDIALYRFKEIFPMPEEEIFHIRVARIPQLFKAFETAGRVSALPRPGYSIIYASRSGLWEMHVGIVYSTELQADGRYLIETIEGNQKDTIRHYLFLYDPHTPFKEGNMRFLENAPEGADELLVITPRNSAWCVKGFGATWK
ncbi:MAG: hypothetical protein FWF47_02935 [Clostridia bacterium]|nr:hypothetical protein [Clostridia bacterium]